ncbi:1-aminocyclopropane-1-carboxylate deaminase/D-cysteine desulfhydrase [Rhodonellum sp.]|uniref:1-aminocyclopropane-1-carboxylate deaminase/D-cysteine desulfhydrase n=1 Tax=Rhodonellum sp. TaxID=2231180 RepID=UPI002727EEF8|nr:pyridoxal-phosphate dependent enzyme [Rhodonellum sp.]MDO9553683.1 pyridoxal-phosphate dependent enzyme [Rhodonellum sp.]
MLIPSHIPTQKIENPLLLEKGIHLFVKRLDLVHPLVSGNKFYKLKHNLIKAKEEGHSQILTFGGAYSNHIYAAAVAAKEMGLKAIGIIRGEETLPLNPTLAFAKEKGMLLHYLNRSTYRSKNTTEVLEGLAAQFGHFYLIPEGGTNALAIQGCGEILSLDDAQFDFVSLSIGTGGTFTGIASSLAANQQLLGFSSLKGNFIHQEILDLLQQHVNSPPSNYQILDQYHFGGYGKHNKILVDFIKDFYLQTGIPLDPIYTGKMMFGLFDLINKGFYERGTKILAIHTGGLQGNIGFNQQHGTDLDLR